MPEGHCNDVRSLTCNSQSKQTFLLIGSISSTCLHAAFKHTDPKSTKKTDGLTVFFLILGSTFVKAVRKILVKWTPPHANMQLSFISNRIYFPVSLPIVCIEADAKQEQSFKERII